MSRVLKQKISNKIVIGKSIIDEANLKKDIEIVIQKGAIFILPSVKEDGWKLLESVGEDAVEGTLDNPSEKHNDYLYGVKNDFC